jgi:hypothetical protein
MWEFDVNSVRNEDVWVKIPISWFNSVQGGHNSRNSFARVTSIEPSHRCWIIIINIYMNFEVDTLKTKEVI